VIDKNPTSDEKTQVQKFFGEYLALLEAVVGSVKKTPKKEYGKLSSFLGYAACSYIDDGKLHDSIQWYIRKMLEDDDYIPTSFSKLKKGDLRNCQGDAISKRFKAIKDQFIKKPEDVGLCGSDNE
jgi:hypothetical protein